MTRRAALAASIAALVVAVLIAVSGGVAASVGGVRVSARSWPLAAIASALLLGAWTMSALRRRLARADLEWLDASLESHGRRIALGIALLSVLGALSFATYSASGSDASGYLSQAAMWSRLQMRVPDILVTLPGWPLDAAGTAPLGWRPALERGWQVPTYAPGLPWLMALPYALGGTAGAVWVVALSAGLAVWSAGALAWRIGGGLAAVLSSIMLATSPTFLIHAFQPMSDVPVTAAWALCWWLVAEEAALGAGVAAAAAVLVRPNLTPLAVIPFVVLMARSARRHARRAAIRFALPVAAAGAAIAWLQWRWYGSPLTSGYGSPGELFALSNVTTNARLYASWLWQAEPVMVMAVAVGVVCGLAAASGRRRAAQAHETTSRGALGMPFVLGSLVFVLGVTVAYLVYAIFEVWTYVRFLLPAIALVTTLIGGVVGRSARAMPSRWRGVAAMALVLMASSAGLHTARTLGVFRVSAVTARAREAGDQLSRTLAARSALIAGEQSGSMRYATGRPIVRWEPLDAASLRAAIAALHAQGFEVWWVLDQFEEPLVRTRFAGAGEAALDWPPAVESGPLMRTRAWRIPDPTGER